MQRYLPALDGVRALAIAIVLAAHGGVAWFRSGGVGVDLFFVLSGFLITSILAAEVAATGRIGFRNFYARRLLRLAPCLLLTCAFVAVARQVTTGQVPWSALVIALTYTANWVRAFSDADLSWLIHCWTLAIEEQFYLLWPPLLLLLERRVRDARTKGFLLVSAALLVAVYRAGMVGLYSDERINYGLDTRSDALLAGAALAYFARSWAEAPPTEATSRLLGRGAAPAALLVLLLVPRVVTWYSPWMGRYGYVVVAAASAVLLADLVAGRHSLLARAFSWRPLVAIGRISYGLYLLHLPVYFLVEGHLAHLPFALRLALKLALSLALAALSFRLIERPCLRLKARFEATAPSAPRRAEA